MTLGMAERQFDILDENRRFCEKLVGENSIYSLLHRERDQLFPDEMFADLFADRGRRSIPPSVVATVMVLEKFESCSDREAVERFTFDLRWKYAAGVEGFTEGSDHTVLANVRARRRPSCDWDDAAAREELIDALVRDGLEALKELEGRSLTLEVRQAAELLATVIGQDIEQTEDGTFRIARRTAPDRVISTVDPEARHGHKSSAHGFDGYKAHIAIDPDSEIITEAEVGAGNKGDGEMLPALLPEFLPPAEAASPHGQTDDALETPPGAGEPGHEPATGSGPHDVSEPHDVLDAAQSSGDPARPGKPVSQDASPPPIVYGDSAYGGGASLALLAEVGATPMVKVQTPHAPGGRFGKDLFAIDLSAGTVTCP